MKLRSLTGFLDPGWKIERNRLEALADILIELRAMLEDIDYPADALCVATPPPSEMGDPIPAEQRLEFARQLEAESFVMGLDWVSIGPFLPEEKAFSSIPEILGATERVFVSGILADAASGISLSAVRQAAETIVESAAIAEGGAASIRLTCLANVPAGVPFPSTAYHIGGPPTVSIAVGGAELVIDAFRGADSFEKARRRLVSMIEAHAGVLTRAVEPILKGHEVRFGGIDFSLAPSNDQLHSIGAGLEVLGVEQFGLSGTLTAAAFVAECIDQAVFRRTGFCGLMLPVLEDPAIAARSTKHNVSIPQLLLYASVCGTGLDMVPIPGESDVDSIHAVLLDTSTLALRLNKALMARLIPIPGSEAGDPLPSEFEGLLPGAVLALPPSPLHGLLGSDGLLDIRPYSS